MPNCNVHKEIKRFTVKQITQVLKKLFLTDYFIYVLLTFSTNKTLFESNKFGNWMAWYIGIIYDFDFMHVE